MLRVFWPLAAALGLTMILLSGTRGALAGLTAAVACFAVAYLLWGPSARRSSTRALG